MVVHELPQVYETGSPAPVQPVAEPQVRAQASAGLRRVKTLTGVQTTAHAAATREDITRFLSRPADAFKKTDPLPTPAGEPIGSIRSEPDVAAILRDPPHRFVRLGGDRADLTAVSAASPVATGRIV